MADLAPQIETAGQTPKSASSDAGSVTQQNIPDLIAADQYLAAKAAVSTRGRGLRFTKLIPPGTLSLPPGDPGEGDGTGWGGR